MLDAYHKKMFRSKRPREILNEIKWRGLDLSRCKIWYIHRGAPNDTKIVRGDEIEEIGHSFFTLKGANASLDSPEAGSWGSKEKRSFSSVGLEAIDSRSILVGVRGFKSCPPHFP